MSYRPTNCAWCNAPFPDDGDVAYGLLYDFTDDGYRVCSAQCENAWYDAGNMDNVKAMQKQIADLRAENDRLQNAFVDVNLDADKRIDEAAEIVVDLLRCVDKLSGEKTLEWLRPSIATANVWLSRPKQ
jgi:hypothetical protein